MLALKVPLKDIVETRKMLVKEDIINKDYAFFIEGGFLYFPINQKFNSCYKFIEKNFKKEFSKFDDDYFELMIGSDFYGNFISWEKFRGVYLKLINKPGKILDIGCANGFLLYYFINISKLKLVPYGIDIKKYKIEKAKYLFPEYKNNFITADIINFKSYEKFDYIIVSFRLLNNKEIIKEYYNMLEIGGKLILSKYDDELNSFNNFENEVINLGLNPSGTIEEKNITKLVWVDKNSDDTCINTNFK